MSSYKRILCPVDFSEASYEALHVAGELALHFSAELTVVHIVFRISLTFGAEGLPPGLDIISYEKSLGVRALKRLEEEVSGHIPGTVSPRLVVEYGEAAQQIAAVAGKERADLIVIATHGMTGWRHYVFGSVAQKVVQHTDRHILVVPVRRPEGQTEESRSNRNAIENPEEEKGRPCIQPA